MKKVIIILAVFGLLFWGCKGSMSVIPEGDGVLPGNIYDGSVDPDVEAEYTDDDLEEIVDTIVQESGPVETVVVEEVVEVVEVDRGKLTIIRSPTTLKAIKEINKDCWKSYYNKDQDIANVGSLLKHKEDGSSVYSFTLTISAGDKDGTFYIFSHETDCQYYMYEVIFENYKSDEVVKVALEKNANEKKGASCYKFTTL